MMVYKEGLTLKQEQAQREADKRDAERYRLGTFASSHIRPGAILHSGRCPRCGEQVIPAPLSRQEVLNEVADWYRETGWLMDEDDVPNEIRRLLQRGTA